MLLLSLRCQRATMSLGTRVCTTLYPAASQLKSRCTLCQTSAMTLHREMEEPAVGSFRRGGPRVQVRSPTVCAISAILMRFSYWPLLQAVVLPPAALPAHHHVPGLLLQSSTLLGSAHGLSLSLGVGILAPRPPPRSLAALLDTFHASSCSTSPVNEGTSQAHRRQQIRSRAAVLFTYRCSSPVSSPPARCSMPQPAWSPWVAQLSSCGASSPLSSRFRV